MPNRPCISRTHFQRTDRRCNKANFYHQCRHCLAVARRAVREGRRPIDIKDVHARQSAFEAHLSSCKYAPSWALPGSAGFRPFSADDANRASLSAAEQPEILDYFEKRFGVNELEEFERLLIEFQADNQLPDTFIARASTKRLFAFLNKLSVASLPSRQVFGGRILDKFAKEAFQDGEAGLRQAAYLSGGRVNFLSDVWMNISKMHLLGCQLSLYGVVCGLGLYPTSDRHDGLAIAEHMEKIMIDAERKGWTIGAVVTDDAGQCARARRILALRWPKVMFLRCFAHSINNIVKCVLRTTFRDVTAQASAVVNCLNSSSSKWLKRADDAMIHTYGTKGVRRLLPLCDTRWNSMQASFASLLRVRSALRVFDAENREDDSYPEDLKVLNNSDFWTNLEEAEEVIRPLCFASFMLQGDDNTLSDVTLSFRQIYDSFVASSNSEMLVEIIEKRWADCEQPLFLLAYALDPRRDGVVTELPADVIDKLGDFALLYYRKIFDANSSSIKGEMSEWVNGKYTMGKSIDDYQQLSTPALSAFFQDIKAAKIRHGLGVSLCDLALAIFAMAVNTATCERYFSELALIHTARRNKMTAEKARKIAAIRRLVRERDARESKSKTTPKKPEKRIVNPNELTKVVEYGGTPNTLRQSRAHNGTLLAHEVPFPTEHAIHAEFAGRGMGGEGVNTDNRDDDKNGDNSANDTVDPLQNWVYVLELLMEDNDCSQAAGQGNQDTFVSLGNRLNPPFPATNDDRFPQERRLPGDRNIKFTLQKLFGVEDFANRLDFSYDYDENL